MKNDFSRLKQKIFLQILLVVIIAVVAGVLIQKLLIDGLLESPFAEGFTHLCMGLFNMSYSQASVLYYSIFQTNKGTLLSVGFFVLLLILFYRGLSRFTKYFNEVSIGMDQLLEESDEEIIMSPEMSSMATKINTIKNTLEKRARSAQEAEQRKNDLVVYLAHDIKTPLTSVIGYLNLLEEAPDMPPEQKAKYVKITLEKAYRLESLINEFFEITRYNLQKISLEPEQIDLHYMLEQMADEFYPMLEPQGKKAVVTAEENLSLYGDPNRLARVFNNILKNAVAYSAPNSLIQIEARQEHGQVIIQFKNRGRTIPPEKLQTIFEKFYRLDTARSSNTGGAGLGLAIAKEIVTLHGGTIAATSDQGETVFTVILPQKPSHL